MALSAAGTLMDAWWGLSLDFVIDRTGSGA
jgi:hypothetical protein